MATLANLILAVCKTQSDLALSLESDSLLWIGNGNRNPSLTKGSDAISLLTIENFD